MNAIRNILAGIGALFVLASCIGSSVPRMNFHVVLADDGAALEYHEEAAKRLRERIKKEE